MQAMTNGQYMQHGATIRVELPDGSVHLGTCREVSTGWAAELRLRGCDMIVALNQPGIMVERLESPHV